MTKQTIKPAFNVLAVFVLALAMTLQAFFVPNVSADQITNRKLTLVAGATDGGSKVSTGGDPAVVNHLFDFTVPTTGTAIGSIKFEYCTTAADSPAVPACVTPSGLSTTSATLGPEGPNATGFSMVNTTNGAPYITRAAAPPTAGALSYRLDSVTNPDVKGSFFVRITTYTSTDTTGTGTDSGTVTASIAEQIVIDGTMPESLVFCAGETIGTTSGVPDCAAAGTTDGTIGFNQLFSPTATATATSQMAASTNAGFGYAITVNGPTLTSGSNTIAGLAAPSASLKGIAQFGLNLVENSAAAATSFPGNSAEIVAVSNGTNYNGRAAAGYELADTFRFATGTVVADSNFSNLASASPSDAQIYTVSYIANVPGSQPAGTYTSTLTYICTPTF